MKRENLDKAFKIDQFITEIENAIKTYKTHLEKEEMLPLYGHPIKIGLSLPASRDVIKTIISDLEIQQSLLEKELLELE